MHLKEYIKKKVHKNSLLWIFIIQTYRSPFFALPLFIYSIWLTWIATRKIFPIKFLFTQRYIPVKINKHKRANFLIKDKIIIESWGAGNSPISITLSEHSNINLTGEFTMGQGVIIHVAKNATLDIKGKKNSTGSGVTCNSILLVENKMTIGFDSIISWGCTISDSNMHNIIGVNRLKETHIGNNVWIGHDVSILPGAKINDGCIVGAKSLVSGKEYTASSLIAGNPAKIIRDNVIWTR